MESGERGESPYRRNSQRPDCIPHAEGFDGDMGPRPVHLCSGLALWVNNHRLTRENQGLRSHSTTFDIRASADQFSVAVPYRSRCPEA